MKCSKCGSEDFLVDWIFTTPTEGWRRHIENENPQVYGYPYCADCGEEQELDVVVTVQK